MIKKTFVPTNCKRQTMKICSKKLARQERSFCHACNARLKDSHFHTQSVGSKSKEENEKHYH